MMGAGLEIWFSASQVRRAFRFSDGDEFLQYFLKLYIGWRCVQIALQDDQVDSILAGMEIQWPNGDQ